MVSYFGSRSREISWSLPWVAEALGFGVGSFASVAINSTASFLGWAKGCFAAAAFPNVRDPRNGRTDFVQDCNDADLGGKSWMTTIRLENVI